MKTCNNCANYKPKNWQAQFSAQSLRGNDAKTLRPVAPVITPLRTKGLTYKRLEQGIVLGACCTIGVFALALPIPLPFKIMLPVSAGTFVLSVALGKDNQKSLFKIGASVHNFLDRNKDGQTDFDDLHKIIDDLRDTVGDLLNRNGTPVHEPGPEEIQYTDKSGTRPIAAPERMVARSLVIRPETIDHPRLDVELDALCSFIRAAVGMGAWSRSYWISKARGNYKLSAGVWQAYFHFFSRADVGLWEIDPPTPDLPGIIRGFRQWATDQPETD